MTAAILAIVIGCDVLVGLFSKKLILHVPDVGQNQTNSVQVLFREKPDVLILGPSSANHHYDCKIISERLHLSAYNAGRDGQNIIYAAMVLASNLERHKPKMVILDMSNVMMDGSWNDHLASMYCYYGIEKSVDEIIDSISDWKERLKLISNLYRYNNTLPWIIQSYFSSIRDDNHGYRPLNGGDSSNMRACIKDGDKFHLDSLCLHYLDMIVFACKKHEVKLVICDSPSLNITRGEFNKWLSAYCVKNQLLLIDYNKENRFTENPQWHYDMSHLNAKGARIFTLEFCEEIMKP